MQPVYTINSFIKRVLINQNKQLTVNELTTILQEYKYEIYNKYRMSAEEIINYTLLKEDSPFTIDTTDTIDLQEIPQGLNNMAYKLLSHVGKPQSVERIARHIRKKTKQQEDDIIAQLSLEKDIRFVKVIGRDRWMLTTWEICNDQLYALLIKEKITETSLNHIHQLISSEIQRANKPKQVWIPETDKRFTIYENGKVHINYNEEIPATEEIVEVDDEIVEGVVVVNEEIAATYGNICKSVNKETKKLNDNNNIDIILKNVIVDLEQIMQILIERNEQMSEEVIKHFNANNLEAIESLMGEKQTNIEMQQDFIMFLEKWKK